MSRSYAYAWQARLPGFDPMIDFEQVCGTVFPRVNCGGGATDGELVDFWLCANRTKARRLAQRLDRHFGVSGTLRRL